MAEPHAQDDSSQKAEQLGVMPSHGISLNLPTTEERPPAVRHMSTPAWQSPLRHHRRASSRTKHVKETLNAHSHYGSSSDDGAAIFQVNQYIIKQEIGRGSFGAVHLAVDQYGAEYAVKEFSKSRLRKRAQSNLLRRPNQKRPSAHLIATGGFNAPLSRVTSADRQGDANNPLELIKEEIAVMKKLNHNNLVSLLEVLDDPEEDSLYMVLEMCKKGVVMKVGLDETADPYDDETCRCWFRDMILGIEYLHAQGIIHRDLKPDNCLITNDDVLKISDFGVSEMFERDSDMHTAKSAGSPAFMPPELCIARHGQISGKAADIWSMGVTLYCLKYGRIPFEKHGMLELYESIRGDQIDLYGESEKSFVDLMQRILEKDADKRITMRELRNHPWVTKNGEDPLLSEEDNCADVVELPTEEEKNHAITGNMGHLMVVMRAVKRFKSLLTRKRPELFESIFGRGSKIVAPPGQVRDDSPMHKASPNRESRSQDTHDRKPLERALTAEGVHHDLQVDVNNVVRPAPVESVENNGQPAPKDDNDSVPEIRSKLKKLSDGRTMQAAETATHHPSASRAQTLPSDSPARGHAHDPLTDTLFLDIGSGIDQDSNASLTISESPTGTEESVYEVAYKQEMDRILERRGRAATLFLTRRVEHRPELRAHENIIGQHRSSTFSGLDDDSPTSSAQASSGGGFADLVQKAKKARDASGPPSPAPGQDDASEEGDEKKTGLGGIAGLVQRAKQVSSKEAAGEKDEAAPSD